MEFSFYPYTFSGFYVNVNENEYQKEKHRNKLEFGGPFHFTTSCSYELPQIG